MTIADWLMIAAVLLGPIIAVQLTRHLDNKKEERERNDPAHAPADVGRGQQNSPDGIAWLKRRERWREHRVPPKDRDSFDAPHENRRQDCGESQHPGHRQFRTRRRRH